MDDSVKVFIYDAMSSEQADEIVKCHELFHRLEMDGFQDVFDGLVMLLDTTEPASIVSDIINQTTIFMDDVLAQHGITVNDDTPLSFRRQVVEALLAIPDYDNPFDINVALEGGEVPIDTLAFIMPLVSEITEDDFLSQVGTVDPALIQVIKEQIQPEQLEPPPPPVSPEVVSRLKTAIHQFDLIDCKSVYAIRCGISLGMAFGTYFKTITTDEWLAMDDYVKACNVFIYSIVSSDHAGNPLTIPLDQYFNDSKTVLAITTHLRVMTSAVVNTLRAKNEIR